MKVVFDESGFLMKLTTFILILTNPYLTVLGSSGAGCNSVSEWRCARDTSEVEGTRLLRAKHGNCLGWSQHCCSTDRDTVDRSAEMNWQREQTIPHREGG